MATSTAARRGQSVESECSSWIDQELDEAVFQDTRLGRRLRALLGQLARAPGQTIALVCQDWANTKAAYRFLTLLHAAERDVPAEIEPIDWKLITDLPVTSRAQAIEKLDWYALRWKTETFHKILKSGCRAENPRLRTAQRLTNLS